MGSNERKRMTKIRLRSKPNKPKKKSIRDILKIDNYDNTNLQSIVDYFSPVDLKEVTFNAEKGFDGFDEFTFKVTRPETDEEFAERNESYKRRLDIYTEWHDTNKNAIKSEIEIRRNLVKEKAAIAVKKHINKVEKEQKRLDKELVRLKRKQR